MRVRNLRFGYDGGGMSCSGYVEGAKFAEITIVDGYRIHFVTLMICDAYEHDEEVFVSEFPVMDIIRLSGAQDEFERAEKVFIESYANEFDVSYLVPEETWKSDYANVIKLCFHALDKYDSDMTDAQAADVAAKFIEPYLDAEEDIEDMQIPDRVIPGYLQERIKQAEVWRKMRENLQDER